MLFLFSCRRPSSYCCRARFPPVDARNEVAIYAGIANGAVLSQIKAPPFFFSRCCGGAFVCVRCVDVVGCSEVHSLFFWLYTDIIIVTPVQSAQNVKERNRLEALHFSYSFYSLIVLCFFLQVSKLDQVLCDGLSAARGGQRLRGEGYSRDHGGPCDCAPKVQYLKLTPAAPSVAFGVFTAAEGSCCCYWW